MSDAEVLFEERGSIGLITLNRPKALNSLTDTMCDAIRAQLDTWRVTPAVQAVVIAGAGEKAFCAGGDVVKVTKAYKEDGDWAKFFRSEYLNNIAIQEFPKPFIALVDGIVMGGGVGVSLHGDYFVATEKTMFAMPETGLGLFPDVGGSYFLPRLPGETGAYLGLTGARIKASDLYALGIASHVVPSDKVSDIIDALANADLREKADVGDVLAAYHTDPEPAPLSPYFDDIDEHFDVDTIEKLFDSLEHDKSEWAQLQLSLLKTKSPTALKVTLEQLKRGAQLDHFREIMSMEYRMVCHTLTGPDFHEGVRAILLDKDNAPSWSPASIHEVSTKCVESRFSPIDVELL